MSDDVSPIPPTLEPFVASDGTRIAVHRFVPPVAEVRGAIVSLHGIQSHAGWYRESSQRLAAAGWEVWSIDRRGSGVSGGSRGHAPHWERLVNDVVQMLNHVRTRNVAGPVVLQGVSWGGKLAAAVARLHPRLIDALALVYPGIHARIRPSLRQRLLLGLADVFGARRRPVLLPLEDAALFTNNLERQRFLREDPLSLRTATTGFLIADRELTRLAQSAGPDLRVPTLLILAGRDRIIDTPAMRRYFESIATRDKTLVEFSEATHTLEFDACFEEFVKALRGWLGRQTKNPGVQPRGFE